MESGNGRRSAKTSRRRLEDPLDLDNPIVNDKCMKAVSIGVRTNVEDFELLEGEAKKEIIDGILSITFSERVHQFISKCMARTVPLKVIGLENDYFSVNFQDDDEYLYAVSGGPWTIFGQYLTIRPWTPSFTTDQDFPASLLVWIRLPGLSEGMYTRSLLKFIARAIGRVAKIDCNNDISIW
ncbi:hypothetical protein Golob_012012, partial [Gossypium lobatum]|nr:hypothetical protein [Gossypium lobatum]